MCRIFCAIWRQLSTKVHTDVVLKHESISELTLAQWARVLYTCIGGPGMMGGNMGSQTAFGREGSSTYLTWKRPFSEVCGLVQPQCSGAAQHS